MEFDNVPNFRPQVSRSLSRFSVERQNKPGVSFSASAFKSRRIVIGRIFSNKAMTDKIMIHNHVANTIERCNNAQGEYILVAQDTTHYNFDSQEGIEGMGFMCKQSRGILQHNVLAIAEEGLPLGLIDQHNWSRKSILPFDNEGSVESTKWLNGLDRVNKTLGMINKTVVLMQDREADIYNLFIAERADNVKLIVRVFQNRLAEETTSKEINYVPKMPDLCKSPGIFVKRIWRNKKEELVRFIVKFAEISILSTKKDNHNQKTLPLNIVSMVEVDENDQIVQNGANWLLLTSLEVKNAEQAFQVANFYCLRWSVERFHYTLKSGALNIEKMQFDDIITMVNAIAFHSVIAWELLYITYLQRINFDDDAIKYYPKPVISLLEKVVKKKIVTLGQYVLALTSLVGFQKSKVTPFPGVKKLAEALERFYYIKIGANLETVTR